MSSNRFFGVSILIIVLGTIKPSLVLGGGFKIPKPPKITIPSPNLPNPIPRIPSPQLNIPSPAEMQRRAQEELRRQQEQLMRQRQEAERIARENFERARQQAAELDRQRLETHRRAQEEFQRQQEQVLRQRQEAQRIAEEARRQATILDQQRLEAQRRAEDIARQKMQQAQELERQAREAVQRMQAEYENANQWVRELKKISNNKAEVRAELKEHGWYVAYGKEIDQVEYTKFATAIAASVATENPGPVMVYLEDLVAETKKAVVVNLKKQGKQLSKDIIMQLVSAVDLAVRTGQITELQVEGFDIKVGIATYKHWKSISGDYPKINLGRVEWEHLEKTIPLPNTHQPYVAFRLRYTKEVTDTNLVPADVLRPLQKLAESNEVQVANQVFERVQQLQSKGLGVAYTFTALSDRSPAIRLHGNPFPGSPAAKLGLEAGDVVCKLDGMALRSERDVANHTHETQIEFIDHRTGKRFQAMIVLP